MHCFICMYWWCILYVSWQIHTDTYRYIQIQRYIHAKCMYCMYLYVSLAISCAYHVHIVCICMYFLQQKLLVVQYIQIYTDSYRYAQDMHKIHAKYIHRHANTCTKFKRCCSAYLYVLYVSCMYHVCIFGGVHFVCICMYLHVSVCIVHMDSCWTSLAPPWYVSVCICIYLYVSVCI